MKTVTLPAVVDENHRLIVDVPDDVPVGPVELTIRPQTMNVAEVARPTLSIEEARAKLQVAGLLVTIPIAPDDAVELTEEEEERLAHEAADTKSIADLIDEDREDRI